MHHMVNEFRPHQARETLRSILEYQREKRDHSIEEISLWKQKIASSISSCREQVFEKSQIIYDKYCTEFPHPVEKLTPPQTTPIPSWKHIEMNPNSESQTSDVFIAMRAQLSSCFPSSESAQNLD
eukprot:Sdes_comp19563_c0_seq1m11238